MWVISSGVDALSMANTIPKRFTMNHRSLLCTAEIDISELSTLAESFDIDCKGFSLDLDPASRYSADQLTTALGGYDAYLCGYDKVTREVLEANPACKVILSVRDGPEENIDISACTELGIPVLACSGRCARSVPEFLMAQLLLMAKPIIQDANRVRSEGWTRENDLSIRRLCESSTELAGKTVGIIGMGRNGRGLAQRLRGFEVKIVAFDPYIEQGSLSELGVTLVSLEELLCSADYVIMMARVSDETRGMLGREELALMKGGSCLINAARAALIDYRALYDEVESGRLRAALDVFETEPLGEHCPWLTLPSDRLLLTSHLAGLSVERITYQTKYLVDMLNRFISGDMDPREFRNPKACESTSWATRGGALWGSATQR